MMKCFLLTLMLNFGCSQNTDSYEIKRKFMVEDQIKRRGVEDKLVLKAIQKVEREKFVPEKYRDLAYTDGPLPIGHKQTISQPYIVAYMTEQLHLKKEHTVLEIGTGSGYQAAILGEIAKEVYTIEIIPELAASAGSLLKKLNYKNIDVRTGDGYKGWPEKAPFDRIIVTAAPEEIPEVLVDQLANNGRMILPVGENELSQYLWVIKKNKKGVVTKEQILPVRFVPMVKE
jgi:protein-L-isoaspartate(D-aspartate) O-methyltransferase